MEAIVLCILVPLGLTQPKGKSPFILHFLQVFNRSFHLGFYLPANQTHESVLMSPVTPTAELN